MTEQPDTAIDQPSEVEGVEPVPPEAESPEQAGPEAGITEHDSTDEHTDEHTAEAADPGATGPGDAGTETLEAGDSGTGDAGTAEAADTAAPDSEDGASADVEPGTPQDTESTVEAPDSPVAPDTPTTPDVTAEAADPTEAQVTEPGAAPAAPQASEVDDADADVVAMDSTVPPLDTDAELHHALEAILLVVDSPASEESLATAVDQPIERVTEALRQLAEVYTEDSRGIDLRRAGEGWRFYTRDKYAPFVEKLLMDGQRSKLTRAALETLAVIAYRQPVTRARVAAVRGVNVDGVIRTLIARGLIEEAGTDSETGGILYTTTELFLERLGLSSLADLPPIAPLLPEVDSIDDV